MQISTVNSLMSEAARAHCMQDTFTGSRESRLSFADAPAVMNTCVAGPVAFSSLITVPTNRIGAGILKLLR